MSLGDHLVELRKRLMISVIAIVLGLVVGFLLSDFVWDVLRQPVYDIAEEQGRTAQINYDDITGAFDTRVQIALFIAVIVSCPIWLYQIWAFLAPGLTKREKLYGVGFLFTAVPLFLLGAYAGWLVIPNIVRLLTSFAPPEDAAFMSARKYLDFSTKLLLAIGIGFVMPALLVMLNFLGVIRGKTILKSWRVAILIIILFAGIATPAVDLMSMFMLAIPLVVLYFAAAGVALLHDRRVDKKRAAELAEYGIDDTDIGDDAGETPRRAGKQQ